MNLSKANYAKSFIGLVAMIAIGAGCSAESEATESASPEAVNQEIVSNLVKAGFPADDIMEVDGKVYVGRDAEVSLAASREMLQSDSSESKEQYRTTNLVGSNVRVICVNGSAFTGSFSTALDNSIANYNNLGLTFSLRRTTGSTSGCNATITGRLTSGSAGGSSGFPSGGLPFNTINIASSTSQYGTAVLTHVITHEIGHTIGFRHTDYFNRSISCGSGGNEGSSGVGAIHISGTPTGATAGGSLMNSCFRSSESGRFLGADVTALQTIY
ncbi:M57 family metalloprotease [Pendulispora albinea]|uniref:M57 family metalloprotease n=1 Tax=Pendulispora albinea TaxID=2741071 RepID=UPI00374E0878